MNFRNKSLKKKKIHFIHHKLINVQNFNLIAILNQIMKFRLIDIFKNFLFINKIPFFKLIQI